MTTKKQKALRRTMKQKNKVLYNEEEPTAFCGGFFVAGMLSKIDVGDIIVKLAKGIIL